MRRLPLVEESTGCSLVAVSRLLIVVASLGEEHRLQSLQAAVYMGLVAHSNMESSQTRD